mmetsp:Transcript_14251/g.56800  ORF Transcript_14251/g.56800 Transcript_14251/m.56800 type:complete len:383 (-) Transcript_14251:190-1338(-)
MMVPDVSSVARGPGCTRRGGQRRRRREGRAAHVGRRAAAAPPGAGGTARGGDERGSSRGGWFGGDRRMIRGGTTEGGSRRHSRGALLPHGGEPVLDVPELGEHVPLEPRELAVHVGVDARDDLEDAADLCVVMRAFAVVVIFEELGLELGDDGVARRPTQAPARRAPARDDVPPDGERVLVLVLEHELEARAPEELDRRRDRVVVRVADDGDEDVEHDDDDDEDEEEQEELVEDARVGRDVELAREGEEVHRVERERKGPERAGRLVVELEAVPLVEPEALIKDVREREEDDAEDDDELLEISDDLEQHLDERRVHEAHPLQEREDLDPQDERPEDDERRVRGVGRLVLAPLVGRVGLVVVAQRVVVARALLDDRRPERHDQ